MVNIKNLMFFLSLLLSFSYAQAQTDADKIRNDESFQKILEKQITLTVTESRKSLQAVSDFQQLVPEDFDFIMSSTYTLEDFEEWISSRIDDSGFESVEDAVAKYKTVTDAISHSFTKQLELGEEIKKVREKFDNKELFETVFTEEWQKGVSKFPIEPLE